MDISGKLIADQRNKTFVYIFDSEDLPDIFLEPGTKGLIRSGTYTSNTLPLNLDDWVFCVYHQDLNMPENNDDLRVIPINVKDPDRLLLVEAYRYVPVDTKGRKILENLAKHYVFAELSSVPSDMCYVEDAYASLMLRTGNRKRIIPGFFDPHGNVPDLDKPHQLHAVCYEFERRRRILHFPNDPEKVSADSHLLSLLNEAQSYIPVLCPGVEQLGLFKQRVTRANESSMPSDYWLP